MAKRWRLESAKSGTTATGRRVLNTDATTAVPTLSSDGYSTQGCEKLKAEFTVTGGSFDVQVWWWSNTSASWHLGELLTIDSNSIEPLDTDALPRIYLQVAAVPGVEVISAWIDLVVQVA